MNCLKIIVVFIFCVTCGKCNKYEITSDLIRSQDKPTRISVFYCDKQEAYKYAQTLSKNGIMTGYYEMLHRPFPKLLAEHQEEFVFDITCPNAKDFLQDVNKSKIFGGPHRWIFTDDSGQQIDLFENLFSDLDILVDSDIYYVMQANWKLFKIVQFYKIYHGYKLQMENFADWNSTTKSLYNIESNRVLASRRKNLQRFEVKSAIVIVKNDSMNHLFDKKDINNDLVSKMMVPITLLASDLLNVTLTHRANSSWGYLIPNTSEWSGISGLLQRNEAHIGGTPFFIVPERFRILNYMPFAVKGNALFLFRQPKLSLVANIYELPFALNVWIACLGFLISTICTLFVAGRWEDYLEDKKNSKQSLIKVGYIDIIFISIGAVCQQGSEYVPKRLTGRSIIFILYLGIMFLFTSYTANIVSLLQSPSSSIKTLDDITNSRLEVGVYDTVYNRYYMPRAMDPVRRKLYLKKIAPPGQNARFMGFEEGMTRMRNGLFAFFVEPSAAYRLIKRTFYEHEKCGLEGIYYLNVPPPYLTVRKHLPFTEHFRIAYVRIMETSVSIHHLRYFQDSKPLCENQGSAFVNVGLVDSNPVFVLFIFGVGFSFCLFVLENSIKFRLSLVKTIQKGFMKKRKFYVN